MKSAFCAILCQDFGTHQPTQRHCETAFFGTTGTLELLGRSGSFAAAAHRHAAVEPDIGKVVTLEVVEDGVLKHGNE